MGPIEVELASKVPGPPLGTRRPARGRVLVIDDDRLFATALQRALSGEHECRSADSGQEALALIAAGGRFDVILCDLMMADMSGMELHSTLRASNPDLADRIIFLTGGLFTRETQAFLESVPNVSLEKPFDVPRLRLLVNERMR